MVRPLLKKNLQRLQWKGIVHFLDFLQSYHRLMCDGTLLTTTSVPQDPEKKLFTITVFLQFIKVTTFSGNW